MATEKRSTPLRKNRKETEAQRERLLAAANEYIRHHGIGDLPLRQLAAELGTSHRMLIYYFGSKEGLMAELMKTIEQESMRFYVELRADLEMTPTEKLWRYWHFIIDPARMMGSRLWLEVFSQALGGRGYAGELLPAVIESWIEPLGYICEQMGSPPEDSPVDGRLVLGVVHGLALQLLATNDREAADQGFGRFVELLECRGLSTRSRLASSV